MKSVRQLIPQLILLALALLTVVPAVAQVPRAVFTELGSATW